MAQQMAEKQGRTLSDACRELTEQLAESQRKALAHDEWLKSQVDEAFDKFEAGKSDFVDNETARSHMSDFKAHIRNKHAE